MTDATAPGSAAQRETRRALHNSVKLSLSLAATLSVGMLIRFWVPRYLGPDDFGQLHFAESLSILFFIFTTLGVDLYVRKEAATRIESAEAYFGGLLVFRLALSAIAATGIALTLWLMHKGTLEWRLAFLFAGWQMATLLAASLESLLHAAGRVSELALVSPSVKLLWAAGMLGGLLWTGRAEVVALCYLLAEVLRALLLFVVVRRRLGLKLRVDLPATWAVVVASAGYFVNYLAHRVYERFDVHMLTVIASDKEVGWYGAAANLATAGLMFLPVVNAVVIPMGARIASESKGEMSSVMRAAVRLVIVGGALPTLLLILHAQDVVTFLFGDAFAPAARGVQVLAGLLPLTYIAVVTSLHLIQLGRIWTVTQISLVGLALNPLGNFVLIPYGLARWGEGGAGVAAAITTVATEGFAVLLTLRALGREGVDRQLFSTLGKTALLAALTVGIFLAVPAPWPVRAALEVIAFVAVGSLLGALPLSMLLQTVKEAAGRRGGRGKSPAS